MRCRPTASKISKPSGGTPSADPAVDLARAVLGVDVDDATLHAVEARCGILTRHASADRGRQSADPAWEFEPSPPDLDGRTLRAVQRAARLHQN